MQRVHLDYMGKKRDIMRWCDDISRRRGGTREGKGVDNISWTDVNLNRPKMEKIHTVDSLARKDGEDLKQ
jgi:hypothetical protein